MRTKSRGAYHHVKSQTLWYAFLISALEAPLVIPRTSGILSDHALIPLEIAITVEVDLINVVHLQ